MDHIIIINPRDDSDYILRSRKHSEECIPPQALCNCRDMSVPHIGYSPKVDHSYSHKTKWLISVKGSSVFHKDSIPLTPLLLVYLGLINRLLTSSEFRVVFPANNFFASSWWRRDECLTCFCLCTGTLSSAAHWARNLKSIEKKVKKANLHQERIVMTLPSILRSINCLGINFNKIKT